MLNAMLNVNKVKDWMREHHSEYRDECGELDCTKLAEGTAEHFKLYEGPDCTIPEWVFLSALLADY